MLAQFDPDIAAWFQTRYGQPTAVQAQTWAAIAQGQHVLATAPIGSGKTLAAFFWPMHQLLTGAWPTGALTVLYISPLKALAADIQRNLQAPLDALTAQLRAAGRPVVDIRVQLRTGDTTQLERQRMLRRPPEILATTPESLQLLLLSERGRAMLASVRLVVLDEVHDVAQSRRGTLLMAGVEQLADLAEEPQRVALSATVRPLERIARFVGGWQRDGRPRPVAIVAPPGQKTLALQVRDPAWQAPHAEGEDGAWPAIVRTCREIAWQHTSTLFFTGSRRSAERLARLLAADDAEPWVAAHHGSLSKEIRRSVEHRLARGELRAVVATSSLELGIDIGELDEVVLLGAPRSIASTIQRVGRAGHHVGATSHGTLLPLHAVDALVAAALVPLVRSGKTEEIQPIVAPLDVLRYTIAVSVAGLSAAENVAIDDVLDPRLEIVAVGQGGKQTTNAGVTTVSWTAANATALASVVPGATATVTFDARVKANTPDGATVPNQAQVKADAVPAAVPSDDPNTPTVNDPTVVLVRTESALEASTKTGKDDNGGALMPGETVTWRITVVATSPAPLTGVRLMDAVPAGMTYEPGSTTLNGNTVPDVSGASPLAAGLALGTLQVGTANAAVVTFRTRLRPDAQEGGQVSNTATAVADNVPPTAIGPATLSIGKGPSIRQTQKTAQVLDVNGNGQADIGEAIVYTVTVRNTGAGAAEQVTLDDPLPNTTHYVGSSLMLDGKPLTDVADGDAGRVDVSAGKVHVDLGTIDAGSQRVVTFQVKILGGVLVSNQGTANAKGVPAEPTDADNDDSNGNQPTVTQIGPAAPLVTVTKAVQDENGGSVQPGDWLRYTLTVQNNGNAKADSIVLQDTLPKGMDPLKDSDVLLPPGLVLQNDGSTLKVVGLSVQAGESAVVSVRARVAANVADASTICNIAKVDVLLNAGTVHAESKPACVTTGAQIGEGAISGVIFEDVGIDDNVFEPQTDLRFPHFQVAVLPPAGVDGPILTAIADDQGQYHVLHVPNGQRRVRVLSPGGAVFLERIVDAPGQLSGKLDLAIRPTGRVYDAHAGTTTPGVRLWLRYDEGDPVAPNALLADDALPPGQQGQTTDPSGAYMFAPLPGRAYRIELATVSAGLAFPVAGHGPDPGIALLDKQGLVVPDALPQIAGNTLPRYLTRFSLQGATAVPTPGGRGAQTLTGGPPAPRHNHLPVEQLSSAIAVGVRLSKAQAQVGDLLYATVTVQNNSTAGFAADALTGRGGVELRNLLPTGLNLVPGGADLTVLGANNLPVKIPLAQLDAPLMVVHRISPTTNKPVGLDLPPGGSLTLRAQMVVTPTAKAGQQLEFAAQLYDISGQQLSGRSTAQFLVQADPLFDKGMVLVKAYCDGNQNGQQDDGEDGLPGARIYADIGQFAVTDAYGRAHLMDIPPGNHLFKLDADTLPPGSTVIGDEQKVDRKAHV